MNDLSSDIRMFINRLRPFERLESGRRVLALSALAYLAQQVGQGDMWHGIRNHLAHNLNLNNVEMDLKKLAKQVEDLIPELRNVFSGGLIADVLQAGAALSNFMLLANSLAKHQEAADQNNFADFFDVALGEVSQGAATGEIVTSLNVSRLMVDLLETKQHMSVLDPSCGLGATLAQTARRTPDTEIFGQEINALLVALARLRLYLLGARCQIHIGDALNPSAQIFSQHKFDRVICDPPIGVKISKDLQEQLVFRHRLKTRSLRSETLFLLHCLDMVSHEGRAVVLMPISFLFRMADKEVRIRLLEQGQLAGVVSLPTGVVAWTELAFALVILRGESARGAPVTLVDGERLQMSTRRGAERLTEDQIVNLVQSYRGSIETDAVARVSAAELLAKDANLRPQIWAAGSIDDREPGLSELYQSARRAEEEAAYIAKQLDSLSVMLKLMH